MFERNETARVTSRQGSEKAEPPKYYLVSWLPKHGGHQKGLSRGLGSIENNDFNAVPFALRRGRRGSEEKLERNDTDARALKRGKWQIYAEERVEDRLKTWKRERGKSQPSAHGIKFKLVPNTLSSHEQR